MNCDEVQILHGPYLDSELDARTSLEFERHLKGCPGCARVFAEEQKLEARIMGGLKPGPRTAALWAQIESSVAATGLLHPDLLTGGEELTQRRKEPQRVAENSSSLRSSAFRTVWLRLRLGWQRPRWAWAGLAAVWGVILALNFTAREPDAPFVAGQELPSASEMRFALKQKQLWMADLALTSEPAPAAKPKPAPPSPRSDRRRETLNA